MKIAFVILIIALIASLFGLVNFNMFSNWLSNFLQILSTPLVYIIRVLTNIVEIFSTNYYFILTLSVVVVSVLFRFLINSFIDGGNE